MVLNKSTSTLNGIMRFPTSKQWWRSYRFWFINSYFSHSTGLSGATGFTFTRKASSFFIVKKCPTMCCSSKKSRCMHRAVSNKKPYLPAGNHALLFYRRWKLNRCVFVGACPPRAALLVQNRGSQNRYAQHWCQKFFPHGLYTACCNKWSHL